MPAVLSYTQAWDVGEGEVSILTAASQDHAGRQRVSEVRWTSDISAGVFAQHIAAGMNCKYDKY